MTLYDILGVSKKATKAEIKKAYRELSKIHHPDKGGDEEKFKEVGDAYSILSDKELRKAYDSGKDLDSLRRVSDDLVTRVFSVFEETIQDYGFVPDHTNLFKSMREKCNEKALRMDRDIESFCGEIRNIRAIQERMKNADIFKGYLNKSIHDVEEKIVRIKEEKKYIGRILDFIKDCDYETEEDDDFDIPQRKFAPIFGGSK